MAVVRDKAVCCSNCYYDIFLSFRGKNTRKSFTDHLYTALIRQGFLTFRDDDEVEKGENLKEELEKAIRQSKSSILVLSEDYASSPWCLDELAMILEKRRISEINQDREHRKHEVLPVFYDVKPSHLWEQTGTIGKEFIGYEKQIEAEKDPETKRNLIEKVKSWRSALTEVAGLIGLELENYDSGSLDIYGCSNLDEVEGHFKSKSQTGLFGMETVNSSSSHFKQWVMLEFGITNLFRPSGEIPWNSIDGKSEGSSITFTVPILLVTHTFIKCLNVFCTFERKDDVVAREKMMLGTIYVKIKNNTKDLTWIYIPMVNYDLLMHGDHWEWWSKWRFGNQLEAGDEITLTFLKESDWRNTVFEVKECGFKIEYQQEEENGEGSTTIHKSHHDFPELRLTTGEYLLYLPFKARLHEDYWLSEMTQWCEELIREDVEEVEFEEDSNDKTPHQVM